MPGFETTNVAAETNSQPPQNAFQLIGQLAETRNALNQNKMFPLQYEAQQLGNTGLGIANATNTQALQAKRYQTLQGILASTSNPGEAASAVARAVSAGLVDPDTAANALGGNIQGLDAASLAQVREQAISAEGNAAELGADRGVASQINTGPVVKTVNTKVQPGGATTVSDATGDAANIPLGLGPSSLATPVETVDDQGAKHMGVLGDYVGADGSWKTGTPHPLTALGPLDANTQATLGSAYGPQIAAFEGSMGTATNLRQNIENARNEADDFTTGPQSDQFKKWGEFLSEFGLAPVDFAGIQTDKGSTAAREAFAKSLTQILAGQQAALHMDQTDSARQTAAAAVPSEVMTPAGLKTVFGIIEGNTDAQLAMGKAWAAQKAKGGPASWGQFQMEFPSRVPPSIFQAQYMTPDQITEMQKGWSPAQKSHWEAVRDAAKKNGWLPNAG